MLPPPLSDLVNATGHVCPWPPSTQQRDLHHQVVTDRAGHQQPQYEPHLGKVCKGVGVGVRNERSGYDGLSSHHWNPMAFLLPLLFLILLLYLIVKPPFLSPFILMLPLLILTLPFLSLLILMPPHTFPTPLHCFPFYSFSSPCLSFSTHSFPSLYHPYSSPSFQTHPHTSLSVSKSCDRV